MVLTDRVSRKTSPNNKNWEHVRVVAIDTYKSYLFMVNEYIAWNDE